MKILQVNKFHYPRGGADKYFLWLSQALRAAGHEVAVFSMAHPKNLPTPWSRYFVSRISFNEGDLKDKLKAPGRIFYSFSVRKNFSRLLKDFKPDIIHIHNIYHHLSPSLLDAARQCKIPVIMHLHDYHLISPDYNLKEITAFEKLKKPYQYLGGRVIKNSRAATALAVLEYYFHQSILKIYRRNTNLFIAPSRFMKEIMLKAGWPEKRIEIVYNPYSPDLAELNTLNNNGDSLATEEGAPKESYLISYGRLSAEKGIAILIKAAALSRKKIKITGRGPEEDNFKKLALELKAPIEFLGFKETDELRPLIEKAEAVVIPSICAENMSLSLLEALSLGKPVIAAKIGGIPEAIKDGENGLLFTAGDAADLAEKIKHLDKLDLIAFSQNARASAARFTPEKNLNSILEIYQKM